MTDVATQRGAALSVTVTGRPGNRRLEVRSPGVADSEAGSCDLVDAEVDVIRHGLRQALTELHDVAGNKLTLTPEVSRDAVNTLVTLARRVPFARFRGKRFFLDAASAHADVARNPDGPTRIVEIASPPDFDFPFELLRWQATEHDDQEPALKVRALLGMSAIVRRRLTHVEHSSKQDEIVNSPRLPLTLFAHPDLAAAATESRYFERAGELIDLDGPWPIRRTDSTWDDFEYLALASYLLNPVAGMDASSRPQPAGIVHFACHCDTEDANSDKHAIDLGSSRGLAHAVLQLGSLKRHVYHDAPPASTSRPLVFLNACGSAAAGPAEFHGGVASRLSFADFFVPKPAAAVAGRPAPSSRNRSRYPTPSRIRRRYVPA